MFACGEGEKEILFAQSHSILSVKLITGFLVGYLVSSGQSTLKYKLQL